MLFYSAIELKFDQSQIYSNNSGLIFISGDNPKQVEKGFYSKLYKLYIHFLNIIQGIALMDTLKFNYLPNSSIDLKLSSTIIDKYYGNFLHNNCFTNEIDGNGSYYYKFALIFRSCNKGEFYRKETSMFFI